eukprot:g36061.t1
MLSAETLVRSLTNFLMVDCLIKPDHMGFRDSLPIGYKIGLTVGDRVVMEGCFSDWRTVASNIPQGSEMGPLLFVTYINNLDEKTGSMFSKFVNRTKIGGTVKKLHTVLSLTQASAALGMFEGDLVNVYKIMRGIDKMNSKGIFPRDWFEIVKTIEFKFSWFLVSKCLVYINWLIFKLVAL